MAYHDYVPNPAPTPFPDPVDPATTSAVTATKTSASVSLGSVTVSTSKADTGSRSGITTSNGTILASNTARLGGYVQNLGTAPLFVKFGTGASDSSFDGIAGGGVSNDDGTGGIVNLPASYTGVVSIYSTDPRANATEVE